MQGLSVAKMGAADNEGTVTGGWGRLGMNCRELVEFLMNYLDGDLPAAVRDEFEAHLRLCPPCLVFLDQYKETIRLGKSCKDMPKQDCKAKVPEDLVQAILRAQAKGLESQA